MDEETYSTTEAAKILQYSNRRVLQMLEAGELDGRKDRRGRWRILQRSVHSILPDRPSRTAPEIPSEGPENAAELLERLIDAERRAARLEGRLELTEMAESTLRESLDRERERADAAELEVKQLQDQLKAPRRSWWRRMFGD